MRGFMRPKDVGEALRRLRLLKQGVKMFYDDPMTEACGCADEFQEDFDRLERRLWGYVAQHGSGRAREMALSALEKWMP